MTPMSLFGYTGSAINRRPILTIDAELSAAPSTPAVFRDVTLVASIRGYEVVAVAPEWTLGTYNTWFWRNGLHDYVSDLVAEGQIKSREVSIEIIGGKDARLVAECLQDVLRHIPILR